MCGDARGEEQHPDMAHDVFVSHSHDDKTVADAVVARLESDGTRCWIAPRDIVPGASWGEAIVDAIGASTVMVLVLSEHSNGSRQVLREVERAVHAGVTILPFRVDEVDPTGALSYFLGTEHWLDAMTPPLERHLERLSETVRFLIDGGATTTASITPGHTPAPLVPRAGRPRWPIAVAVGAAVVVAGVVVVATRGDDDAGQPPTTSVSPDTTIEQSAPTTASSTTETTAPTTTAPTVALEEVARFAPFDLDLTDQHVPDPITGIDIHDGVLAYANGVDGVTLMSVTAPETPMAMATYAVTAAQAVELDGNLIYAIGGVVGDWRFEVFDTDGSGAVELPISGTNSTDFDDIEVADGFAYVSGWDYVGIVDVTEPAAPRLVVDWVPDGSTGNPAHVTVDGTTAYFAAGWDGLYVFDVTDPGTPALLDHWISPDWIIDVAVDDGIAYVSLGETGMAVLDVTDPTSVTLLGTVELPGFASMIDVEGAHVAVGWFGTTSAPGGVAVVDVTDPTAPALAGSFGSFFALTDLQIADGHVYVTDEADDLVVFRITDGSAGDGG